MRNPEPLRVESSDWLLEVAPAWGGSLLSLQCKNQGSWRDLARPATALARARGDRLGMSAWPLLPYSNRIPGGKLRARFDDGTEPIQLPPNDGRFAMPIHGVGWQRAWRVAESTPSQCRLTLAEPASEWPWAFHADHRIAIEDDQLRIAISVRNDSEAEMPCGLGWHPYFLRTPLARLRTRFLWKDESDPGTSDFVPVRRPVEALWSGLHDVVLSRLSPVDNCFGGWDGSARLVWPEWGLSLAIEAHGAMAHHCVIYCPADADFICVEPVSHANFALGRSASEALADGIVSLSPGQTLHGELTLRTSAIGNIGK
ncbi:MAG: aldose 1-epimerase [Burkholderiales bacterium]